MKLDEKSNIFCGPMFLPYYALKPFAEDQSMKSCKGKFFLKKVIMDGRQ